MPDQPQQPQGESQQPQQQQIQLDTANANAAYANFCRVTGTPEEVILDLGLNTHGMGTPTEPIPVTQRIIMNYYTAKRLAQALAVSINRHEKAFGELETDIQKRVKRPGGQ